MRQIVIILLPVDEYDRIDDAEKIENKNYYKFQEIQDDLNKNGDKESPLIYTSMSNFMLDCNDQNINLELYWLTYVNLLT